MSRRASGRRGSQTGGGVSLCASRAAVAQTRAWMPAGAGAGVAATPALRRGNDRSERWEIRKWREPSRRTSPDPVARARQVTGPPVISRLPIRIDIGTRCEMPPFQGARWATEVTSPPPTVSAERPRATGARRFRGQPMRPLGPDPASRPHPTGVGRQRGRQRRSLTPFVGCEKDGKNRTVKPNLGSESTTSRSRLPSGKTQATKLRRAPVSIQATPACVRSQGTWQGTTTSRHDRSQCAGTNSPKGSRMSGCAGYGSAERACAL